jgi:phosphoadenosine phosphosulfate reductase
MEQPHFDTIQPSPYDLPLSEKIPIAIKTLQTYEATALEHDPVNGYFGCFSGGKDSVVVKRLAEMAGVKVKWWYSCATIDPPDLIRFIKREHADVEWRRQEHHMWTMVEKRGLPTRRMRWCCAFYKETGGAGLIKISGIRGAESKNRATAWSVMTPLTGKLKGWMCNPAFYWTDADVWAFIRSESIPYCHLYDEGFKRLGCLGCPMSYNRKRELEAHPGYMRGWRKAAHRYWDRVMERDEEKSRAFRTFANADEWFDWWISNESMPDEDDGCQMGLF